MTDVPRGRSLHAQTAVGRRVPRYGPGAMRERCSRAGPCPCRCTWKSRCPGCLLSGTTHGKMDLAPLVARRGIFNNRREDVFQFPSGAFVKAVRGRRDMPAQGRCRIFSPAGGRCHGPAAASCADRTRFFSAGRIRREPVPAGAAASPAGSCSRLRACRARRPMFSHTGTDIMGQGALFELAVCSTISRRGAARACSDAGWPWREGAFGFHGCRAGQAGWAGHERQEVLPSVSSRRRLGSVMVWFGQGGRCQRIGRFGRCPLHGRGRSCPR